MVESSSRRCFADESYREAGAQVVSAGSNGDVSLGIRNLSPETFEPGSVHLLFLDAASAKPDRMSVLKKALDGGATVIDLQGITDAQGKRLVGLGPYSGHAGALNGAWLLGRKWAGRGLITPLAHGRQAKEFADLSAARNEFRQIGRIISDKGFPRELNPVTIGILGHGPAAKGIVEVLENWPVEWVDPAALSLLCRRGGADPRKVYLTAFEERHLVERLDGHGFDFRDYIVHPWLYRSRFDTYLPWLTAVINAVSWDSRYPRFVTWASLAALAARPGTMKLEALVDLPGHVEGSIECTVRATDSEHPAYLCDPVERKVREGVEGDGVLVTANGELEGELPVDTSIFLSGSLKPYLPQILLADFDDGLERSGLSEEVRRSVVACRGELTEGYRYLGELVDQSQPPAP